MSDKKIVMNLEAIMGDRFGKYSKYIIQERALPDVRDGLKPVQRRILYSMNKEGNTANKPYRKSAKTVGNVIGNYHPHGDTSVYDAMVRLSQEWKIRAPLIDMQGNNGSIDNDPAAAMRYTEARLSPIASELLRDLDKDTVLMSLNFDDTEYEPTVLPAAYPNLLVNGSTGISAGYATDIPPHNLQEVIDATIHRIKYPHCHLDKLMEFIKGPDFPTGAIVEGLDGIKKAFEKGKGKVIVRAKTEIIEEKNMNQIVVTEIPYEVNKAELVRKIDEIRFNKNIDGILEVRDESDREGLRIVIDLKKTVNVQNTLNYFYKNTDLQKNYNYNMVAIKDKRPVLMGIEEILDGYIDHQIDVVTRASLYDLNKANERLHIVDGLIKAISILDDVVKTIRASKDKSDAKNNLIKQYAFSEKQAEAIVMLQLYRLTNTDIVSLQSILTDKKSRGIYGEVNLKHIMENVFGVNDKIYKLQCTLPNTTIADCVLYAPEPLGTIIIDSKFPLENYQMMVDKNLSPSERAMHEKQFKIDVKKHIDAISSKYIIQGVTSDQAIMFLPAEAIFAEINAYHQDVIDYAYKKRVWITSPTTLISTLTVVEMIIKNIERDKYTKVIHEELNKLGVEFSRYKDRWDKLSRSIQTVNKDVESFSITTEKLSKKFQAINRVEIKELDNSLNIDEN